MPARNDHGGLTPKMRVYFPQYVTVNNPRLACLFWIVTLVVGGYACYQFIGGRRYEIKKLPEGEIQICSQKCRMATMPTAAAGDNSYCVATKNFDPPYTNVTCIPACSGSTGWPCISQDEAVQYNPSTVFIPTFIRESTYWEPSELVGGGWCQYPGYKVTHKDQVCTKTLNYFVPNVAKQTVQFHHKFNVALPTSTLFGNLPDEVGNSAEDLKTVLLDAKGEKKKEFAGGQTISMTVAEMLEAAGISEVGKGLGDNVKLDAEYERKAGGVKGAIKPTPRLTGLQLTFELGYTNEGSCRLNLETDKISVSEDKVACLAIKARRQWTQTELSNVLSLQGTSISRKYSGILIDFHVHGSFKFRDWSRIFRGVTTIVIWLGIPIWVLYFFALYFLGQLSVIYNRVIHQELSLSTACVGLASRLISHTSAFADVADQPDGLSKQRLLERFQMIMQFSEDLDDAEVRKFVDFIFEGVAIASADGDEDVAEMAAEAALIDVQDFCTVCLSNESITFDALVKIFDRDRRLGTAETIFCDDIIVQSRSASATEKMRETVDNAMVKMETTSRSSQMGEKQAAGGYTAHALQARTDELDAEIHMIQEECSKIVLKQKTVLKQVANAEETLAKLGGTP